MDVVAAVVEAAAAVVEVTVAVEGILTCQQELGCGEQSGPSKRNVQELRGR